MDTQSIESPSLDSQTIDARERRLPRILTTAALACFALPFLTVTCYGDTTVSGVQAATEIDIYPNDDPGEKELLREEGPNAFAFVALAAAIAGLALAAGSARSRVLGARVSAVGAIAVAGLFVYAFYRSWGGAWPRIGFTGALMFLVGAAWAGVERVPRWIPIATAGVAASMVPGTVISIEDLPGSAWLYVPVYAGVFIAIALAVGAIGASARSPEPTPSRSDPSALRLVCAGIVGLACVAVAAVGSPVLMGAMLSSPEYAPDGVGKSYAFATMVLAMTIAASVVAWIAGRAIVHGRRVRLAPMRAEVGV
jgi:hypothetical protein